MSQKLQSVKGMNDILPADTGEWQMVERLLENLAAGYDYREIRTPVLEKTALFSQSIGEQTDIVEKEMYAFSDTGGEQLCLRPENTAAVVRAGVQHGLFHNAQARLWYLGPMFRRERPQKGRYRQFHQFGMEAIGWTGPDIDAEILLVGARIWRELKVGEVALHLNTLGSDECRQRYRDALLAYLSDYAGELDEDSQRRLQRSPLRILDSKHPRTQEIVADGPKINDYLDAASGQHFARLCQMLEAAGVAYQVDSALVRGLDYYTSTVFEWKTTGLGAQGTVCAGGRYDKLVESRGGQSTPACGFAMGLERLIELRRQQGVSLPLAVPDIYLLSMGEAPENRAPALAEKIRDAGLRVALDCGGGKFQKQLKRADKSGARWAFILGENELAVSEILIKDLREPVEQTSVHLDSLDDFLVTLKNTSTALP